jgi:hypothetical protein
MPIMSMDEIYDNVGNDNLNINEELNESNED